MRNILFLLLIASPLYAQVESEWSKTDDNKCVFSIRNDEPCPYTYYVKFNNKGSFDSSVRLPYLTAVKKYGDSSFYITCIKGITPDLAYTYNCFMGDCNAKPVFDYPYLLPISQNKETEIGLLDNFSEKHNMKRNMKTKDWYAIQFKTNKGDTIYAVRRGVVCDVKDDAELEYNDYSMSTKDNQITICHQDNTFARYSVLSEVLVKKGQEVEAGEPIAITGGEKYASGYQVRLSISYLYKIDNPEKEDDLPVGSAYVTPRFYLSSGEVKPLELKEVYISTHPQEIITKEMSKKELKKYLNR
ncbi:MAG: M23 family metallopeptidase [Candidatus Azobacteroides sp.]|nr:M23 family metallopeptidase [Candidatus Azobacteroides sp.]